MAIVFTLTQPQSQFTSGSFDASGTSIAIVNLGLLPLWTSGSWEGCGCTLDVVSHQTTGSFGMYKWQALANIQSVAENSPPVNYSDNEISNTQPSTLQGPNILPWNPFPVPEQIEPVISTKRDESRYKKVSSYTRAHPVRIKIVRRTVVR